jgi:hypothetical protein
LIERLRLHLPEVTMRQVVASLVVLGCIASLASAGSSQKAADRPVLRACSLLTRDLAARVTPANKVVLTIPPSEESLGASGSACSYAGIELQVDPFTPTRLDALAKERGKAWAPVEGVGDAAYFFDNRGEYAELYARVGGHVFTIQMDVPDGSSVSSIKANVVTLAKALVPQLK